MDRLSRVRQQGESLKAYHARLASNRNAVKRLTRPINGTTSTRKALRNEQRKNGNLRGTYGAGIIKAQTARQRRLIELRNEKLMA